MIKFIVAVALILLGFVLLLILSKDERAKKEALNAIVLSVIVTIFILFLT